MKGNFRQRAEALRARLEQIRAALETATPEETRRLLALAGSIQRSLRWYTARAGSRWDIYADKQEPMNERRFAGEMADFPNVVMYADELAAANPSEWSDALPLSLLPSVQATVRARYPIALGIVQRVTFDPKAECYLVHFESGFLPTVGPQLSTAKVTHAVAQYVLTEANGIGTELPTVYAHMENGTIDTVALLFTSRVAPTI
jgi:hypothetical protein